tara:strand:+ start:715 stop:1602 length:888 start_codon:yes stop_codon:yes gene_type:complete
MKFFKSVFRRYRKEKLRYYLKGVDVLLITSSGRTGTQFFETLYKNVDKNRLVIHEPKPDFFNLSLQKIRYGRSTKKVSEYIASHRGKIILSKYGMSKRIFGKKIIYVESNPFAYPLLEEYRSLVKSFKVIYISRDPSTYLVSAYNKDPSKDEINNFYGESDKRKRLTAVDFKELSEKTWCNFERIEKIAWYWNKSNELLYDYTKKYKNDSIYIKFESLFSSSENEKISTLKKILYFSEGKSIDNIFLRDLLNLYTVKINKSSLLSEISNFEDLDSETQIRITKIIEPMAKKLNYI